jgi:hypothetical protein
MHFVDTGIKLDGVEALLMMARAKQASHDPVAQLEGRAMEHVFKPFVDWIEEEMKSSDVSRYTELFDTIEQTLGCMVASAVATLVNPIGQSRRLSDTLNGIARHASFAIAASGKINTTQESNT